VRRKFEPSPQFSLRHHVNQQPRRNLSPQPRIQSRSASLPKLCRKQRRLRHRPQRKPVLAMCRPRGYWHKRRRLTPSRS